MHVLIDLDNVLLTTFEKGNDNSFFKLGYWTQNLKRDLGIEPSSLHTIFTHDFLVKDLDTLYMMTNLYLKSIQSNVTIKQFLNYWLKNDSSLNEEVWTWILKNHTEKKHDFYIASDQSCIRMNYLLEKFPSWKHVFKKVYTSYSLGICKNNTLFFEKILRDLNVKPTDICLVDDNPTNIETAEKLNFQTILFTNLLDLKKL